MTEVANKINKNGNVPALRFPEFEGEWVEKKLGEVASIKSGSTPLRSNRLYFDEGDIPWVKTTDLNNSNIFDTEEKITHHANARINPVDTVLVAMYGGFNQIGRTGYLKVPAATNQALSAISPSNDYLQPAYLHIWLNAKVNLWKRIASSSRKDPNITGSDVAAFPVAMPSIIEQSKIASFLSLIDERISTQNKIIEELKTLKAALSKQIFSQKLRFKDVKGKDFPEWEEKRLGDCLDYIQPTKYLVNSTEYDNSYTTPVLTAGKTFILGYTNESHGIFKEELPVIIFDDFTTATKFVDFPFKAKSSAMKILRAKSNANVYFMYEAMQILQYELGGHERHWISKFSPMTISIPSGKEQNMIADFLSKIDQKIELELSLLTKLEEQKKYLLKTMFI